MDKIKNQILEKIHKYKDIIKVKKVLTNEEKIWLQNELIKNPDYKRIGNIIKILKNGLTKCPCGKDLSIKSTLTGALYCSNECKHKYAKIKYIKTCLQKYGVISTSQLESVKNKVKKTMLTHFGVESYFKTDECKTLLNKKAKELGVSYVSQSDLIKNKVKETYKNKTKEEKENQLKKSKETCLKKYGVENYSKTNDFKKKVKNTSLKKYGTDSYSKTNEYKNRRAQTCLNKFGKSTILQTTEVQNITKQNYFHKTYKSLEKYKNYVIPNFSENEFTGFKNKKIYSWKCVKCGNIFEQFMYQTSFLEDLPRCPRCLKCFPFHQGHSTLETEIINYVKTLISLDKISLFNRTLISPYELDIVIPSLKLAIEFNGDYWHSESKRQSNYHLLKTNLCKKIDYTLYHIFEYEWINPIKQNIIKQQLKFLLKNNNLNNDTNFIIQEISNNIAINFLQFNCLNNNFNFKNQLGLFKDNKLISVIGFNLNKNKLKIVNYADTKNSFNYFINYFKSKFNLKSINYMIDLNKPIYLDILFNLGFKLIKREKPKFIYLKNNHIDILSQNEIIKIDKNKFFKIYDCGKLILELNI